MGNGTRHDPQATSGSYRTLNDKEMESFRGLVDRGLKKAARPAETLASMYDAKRGEVLGCRDQDTLNDLVNAVESLPKLPPNGDIPNRPIVVFDRQTLRRLIIVGGAVATFHNRTPCLLRLAALMDRSLSRQLHNNFRSEFFDLVEVLIGIGDEIISRTRRPYKFFADGEVNPKLDPGVLLIEPLANYHFWKTLLDARARKAILADPIPITDTRFSVEDEDAWQQTLDEIERNLEVRQVDVVVAAARKGDAPVINGCLENLRQLKFSDIERQSRARFPWSWRDDPVLPHVELIIYHSVFAVLLDQYGNPFRRKGIAPHSVLIPDPGDNLLRNFHPPGLYLSAGPLGDYQFAVSGKKVKNLLFAGITSMSRTQSTFSFEHYLQERLQAYINNMGIHAVAAITVDEAFGTPDLTLSGVKRAVPVLIDETTRYALIELLKRAQRLLSNYEEVLKTATEQVIRGIIEKKIRDWCIEWLIKKIGKKIIPGVNVVSAISELFDDEEHEMIRALVACVIMVTKSKRRDDLTICAKITANIAIDKVQEAVIQELVKRGGKRIGKRKAGDKDQEAPDKPKAEQPQAPAPGKPATAPDPTQGAKPPAGPDAPGATGKGPPKPVSQQQIIEEMRLAQQVQNLQKAGAKPEAKPDVKPQLKPEAKPEPKPEAKPQTQPPPEQRPRWQHQQVQQQQTKRPDRADPAVTDTATENKAVPDKGADPRADKPGTTRPRQPDAPTRRADAPGDNATDAKAKDAKVTRDDEGDPRSTRGKNIGDRNTTPPPPARLEEPPIPPSDMPWRDRWKFYEKHRDGYPPHIQQMLDNANRTEPEQKRIEREIKDYHAEQLSHHWGIPVKSTERIPMERPKKPLLPSENASLEQRWKYYDKHKDTYPPHIQRMLNTRDRSEEQSRRVEQAIKEHHASQPRQETSGGDWEKTNIAERTGERPTLTATSTTKDGAEVQIDDFDPARRVAREYKASLEVPGKDPRVAEREIQERMERHAQFAEDRGLAGYEWVAHSKDSYEKMTDALADLRGKAQQIPDKDLRDKLLERYKKITIVKEPILDK